MTEKQTPNPPGQRWWRNRRKLLAALAGAVVLLAGTAAVAYAVFKRPADVDRGEVVPFVQEEPKRAVVKTTNWPLFGFNRARTRFMPANRVKPPFKRLWKYGDRPLLEFPPIFVGGRLYFVDNNGHAISLDADSGRILWKRRIAKLNASAPAYWKGRLLIVNLEPGQVVSLNARTGKTIWKRSLSSRSESSPVVVRGRVYFGDEGGNLHSLRARDGRTVWTTQLSGPVKAAPAYRDGKLYVGDYGGEMSAVRARNGEIVWQAGAQGLSFSRTGAFYSTPAVAFGRVYSGNNDGRVYSFDSGTGQLAWSHSTGGYVYSGPAVAGTPHTPPTVYIGSFDGNVYALDARTGDARWTRSAGGRVIGSLSVIGTIVYVATFDGTTTSGFKLKGGRKVFEYHTGAYMPAISDGRRLYLTGYSSVHALQPFDRAAQRREQRKRRRAQRRAAAAEPAGR